MGIERGVVAQGGGVDCTKLMALMLVGSGVLRKIEPSHYNRDWFICGDQEVMIQAFTTHCVKYLKEEYAFWLLKYRPHLKLELGDIICYEMKKNGLCNHTSMYWGHGKIIHAIEGPGVHFAEFNEIWQRKARFVFRIIDQLK